MKGTVMVERYCDGGGRKQEKSMRAFRRLYIKGCRCSFIVIFSFIEVSV